MKKIQVMKELGSADPDAQKKRKQAEGLIDVEERLTRRRNGIESDFCITFR